MWWTASDWNQPMGQMTFRPCSITFSVTLRFVSDPSEWSYYESGVEYLTTECNSTCLKHFITDFRLYSFMPLSWSRCWHCLTIMAKYQNSILLWYRLESIKNCTKDGTECLVWFVVLFTNSLIKHVYILQGIKKLRLEKNSWALKLNTRTLHTAMIHLTFDYISTYISL